MEKNKINWGLFIICCVGIFYCVVYWNVNASVNVLTAVGKQMCITMSAICAVIILLILAKAFSKGRFLSGKYMNWSAIAYSVIILPLIVFYLKIANVNSDLSSTQKIKSAIVILFCVGNILYNLYKATKKKEKGE